MATIYNESIGDEWVDLNTLLGIAVGTTITIQNQSGNALYIQESDTEPTGDISGFILTRYRTPKSSRTMTTPDYTIWVRSVKTSLIGVQED